MTRKRKISVYYMRLMLRNGEGREKKENVLSECLSQIGKCYYYYYYFTLTCTHNIYYTYIITTHIQYINTT